MHTAIPDAALDQLFREARTYNQFVDRPVDDDTLRRLYALYRWGPTAMNSQPGRVVFVRSALAKQRLGPALNPGNFDKTMAAPVTAIVAYAVDFFEHLPAQYPANPGARALGMGICPWSPLGGGFLSGKYTRNPDGSVSLGGGR